MLWIALSSSVFLFVFNLKAGLCAADSAISAYSEYGEGSTAEDFQEEDTDDSYHYRGHHFRFRQAQQSGLDYDISSFFRSKDYSTRDSLDNLSRLYKANFSYNLNRPEGELLNPALKLLYREKRFKNTPANEYDQLKASGSVKYEKKGRYLLGLDSGLDNFEYLSPGNKDRRGFFSKLGARKYFLDEKLALTSSYGVETAEHKNINRRKTRNEVEAGFDYIPDNSFIQKFSWRGEWAQRDTKADETREEDLDYETLSFSLKSRHKIAPALKTDLKYQSFQKDYLASDLDHQGFSLANAWDYELLDTKSARIGLELELGYKQAGYSLKPDNDYKKESASAGISYQRKKSWKAIAAWEENSYRYNNPATDKERHYLRLSGEKLFRDGDLSLGLDFKYKYTDYAQKDDLQQSSLRLSLEYKF